MSKKAFVVLAVLMILGLLVRIRGTLGGYFAFTYDQGRDMLAVYDIVINHKMTLIGPTTGLPGIFYGPWWYYFMAPLFLLSGGNPTFIVLAISVLNVLMIPVIFLLGKEMADERIGFIMGSFVSLSPVFISSSVQLWSPNLAPLFTLLGFFFLWMCLKKGKIRWFFSLGFFAALVQEAEVAYGVVLTLALVSAVIYLKVKKHLKANRSHFFVAILGYVLIVIPRILFDFRHQFLITHSVIDYLTKPKVYQTKLSLFERFLSRIETFFLLFTKTLANEQRIIGFILLSCIAVLLIRFFHARKKFSQTTVSFAKVLMMVLAMFFLLFVIYPDALWEYYLIGLPTLFVLILGIALIPFRDYSSKLFFLLTGIILLIASSPMGIISSFTTYWEGDASVFRNQTGLIDRIYADAGERQFSVLVYTPALIDYPYQYLFLWYGKKRYGYRPVEKSKLVYYILEGDKEYFGRKNWLKEHDGDGIVVQEKILPGQITLQKRLRT